MKLNNSIKYLLINRLYLTSGKPSYDINNDPLRKKLHYQLANYLVRLSIEELQWGLYNKLCNNLHWKLNSQLQYEVKK